MRSKNYDVGFYNLDSSIYRKKWNIGTLLVHQIPTNKPHPCSMQCTCIYFIDSTYKNQSNVLIFSIILCHVSSDELNNKV